VLVRHPGIAAKETHSLGGTMKGVPGRPWHLGRSYGCCYLPVQARRLGNKAGKTPIDYVHDENILRLLKTPIASDRNTMASGNKKGAKARKLPALTDIQRQVVAYVLNNVAFKNYDDCCSVEDMVAQLNRTPRGLMSTLRKLEEKGYVTIKGTAVEWVYPTVEALRQQDKTLSEQEAKAILKRIDGTRR
jgi:DNA-binding transcriptional regulator YhcF (GntR family)